MKLTAWRRYFTYYRGSALRLAAAILVASAQSLLALPVAWVVGYTFDHLIPARHLRGLLLAGGAMVLLALLSSLGGLWARSQVVYLSKAAMLRLRLDLLDHLYRLSRAYYTQADQGKLQATVVQDSDRVDIISNTIVVQLVPALIGSLVLAGALLYLNWALFLALCIVIPLLLWAGLGLRRRMTGLFNDYRLAFRQVNRGILRVLQLIDLTRQQSAEQQERAAQHANLSALQRAMGRLVTTQLAYNDLQTGMISLAGVIILVLGGWAVVAGRMSLGELMSFYVAVALLTNYLRPVWGSFPALISGSESLESLFALLDEVHLEPYHGAARIDFQGELALEAVNFSYDRASPEDADGIGDSALPPLPLRPLWGAEGGRGVGSPILHNLTLHLPRGSTTVLVGPNGAGKTTLLYLILGFYRPESGRLLADGRPYADLDLPDLRRQIGVVEQNPVIFPASLWDNLVYGRPDATPAEVERACRLATADQFLRDLPEGYATFVGENGLRLSGGQRQRLALARALLRNPRLLVLDEPTNHMDAQVIQAFLANLAGLRGALTLLMISHDPAVIALADQVYRLEKH